MNTMSFLASLLRCRTTLLGVLCLLGATQGSALDPNKTLTQYAHRTWGQEEGLIQPTIYSIAQTPDGFLWLGTQDSLIRFDGVHFREYDNAQAAGLKRNLIRALLAGPDGSLWVATIGSGVVRIRPDGGFVRLTTRRGLPSNNAFCLAPGTHGAVWICTEGGLVRVDEGGRIRVFTTADGLPANGIRDSCTAADGSRWVEGLEFGLSHWTGSRFEAYSDAKISPRLATTALTCAKDGNVWVGTEDGLIRIGGGPSRSFTADDGLPDNEVSSLEESPDGSLWIGTNDGISRLRNGEISVYRTRDGLSHSLVLSLFIDHEGSLWGGTKDGLDQFTDGKVTPYSTNEGLLSNDVGPVVEDKIGQLWIGTLDHGLNVFDGHHFRSLTTRNGLLDDSIQSLVTDSNGDLWVGTSRGLNRLRDDKVIAAYTEKDGLSSPSVRALAVDEQGVLWAGTSRGLDRLEGNRFVRLESVPRDGVVALAGGHSLRLFVSNDESGFFYVKDTTAAGFPLEISHAVDCYLIETGQREAWFGTLGSGLLRWKNGTVTHIRVKDGLYDNRIYSILRDGKSNFWMASSKGIFRVSEADLQAFADGKINYVNSLPFTTGQLRFECRAGVQPAACRTHDGRLWFSTTNGLVVVDPNSLLNNTIPPPVSITSIIVNGERMESGSGIHLSPSQRNLEVRYAGLSLVSPEKVTFRYLLDGYEKNWTDAGSRREAFYTNLPPGNFHFRVMARNADGVWSQQAASLSFTVDPRLYQRWWFFPLLVVLAAGLILVWVRVRIHRLKQRFDLVLAERSRIARELHDTLLQGLSGITMQLQALWTKWPASRERLILGEIIQDAAKCSTEARQSLWGLRTIGPGSPDFAGKLATLARQAANHSSIYLSLKLDPVSLRAWPEVEYQLLRIAQEAISNSLRHADAKKLEIRLQSTAREANLTIADDGVGFEANSTPFGHFGLVGMRERAEEIGAELNIVSVPGNGTSVQIRLPLVNRGGATKGRLEEFSQAAKELD
jgi:signal transduction histidine kinase/ligand-binding sensor domain-containing protein